MKGKIDQLYRSWRRMERAWVLYSRRPRTYRGRPDRAILWFLRRETSLLVRRSWAVFLASLWEWLKVRWLSLRAKVGLEHLERPRKKK